jgi:signal transduction histidine kinase/ligand-binding sensor domain-containing protein/CheY-like chemotaxis protein
VGTAEGLLRADPAGAVSPGPFGVGLAASSVTALAEDAEGQLWAATVAGDLHRLSPDGALAEPPADGLPSRTVVALVSDRDGALWAGSGAGLVRLSPRTLAAVTVRDGLSAEVVWSVYADPLDGALWLGMDGPGLDRLAEGRLTSMRARWGLAGATVSAALRTRDGELWVSLRSAGVARIQGDRLVPVLDAGGAPYVRVRGLYQASDGGIWLGTETGLERHQGGRASQVPVSGGWPFRVIAEDRHGALWAGGDRLVRLEGPARQERTPPGLEEARAVMQLLPDGDDLWIASYSKGLQLWRGGRLTSFGALDRRLAGRAVAVLADQRGGLWVALEGSLILARRQDLQAAADGRTGPLGLQAFDERDGMPSTEFTASGQSPAAITPDGRLWFGTVGGLVMVDPARLARRGSPAPPRVERAFVGGQEVPLAGGVLRLVHGDDALELQFTTPTMVSPHQIVLRHRLAGHDVAWQPSGPQRAALYRGLGEGDYRFELEASRDGTDWVPIQQPLRVEVRPGPLERGWVRAALAAGALLLLAAVAAAVGRLRGRRLRARARELSRLVEERTRELAAARDTLEARVEERTGQLQRELAERERLERQLFDAQKLDSIGRLAGGVAHDLNNLLTVVLGCASTAQLPGATAEEVREDLGEIQKAGDRAAALTRQLLAFARRQILSSRRLDLNDVVAGVGTLLRRLIGAHIELVTDVAAAPCPVLADPGQLEQVLVNLAVNARDAMPGGGTLRVETAAVELAQDLGGARPGVAAGAWVRLRVRDTGTGLSEEAARHLFEPFFTTKEKGKGTGLGLATCYGIVKQMGGHIWLQSEPGRGTTVEIHLPRAEGKLERPPAEGEAAGPAAAGGGERILVVEDEPQVRALAARALVERGYQVLTAGDGEEALRVLEAAPPVALLLTDVIMPRMGGAELAARLVTSRPGTAVLFMSGYVDRTAVGQGALPEGADVLLKPFTPATLAARVRAVLDGA